MKDISDKSTTLRTARAKAIVRVTPFIIEQIKNDKIPKGDPRSVAKIAAIQAAKNTWQIIPYCHQLPIDFVGVDLDLRGDIIEISTHVKAIHKTGVEMEAMTAASIAALTVYDMLKFLDTEIKIESVALIQKTGGKSDFLDRQDSKLKAAVLVMSDSISSGKAVDKSGKLAVEKLNAEGIDVVDYKIISDDEEEVIQAIKALSDEKQVDLIITSGGTGIGPRDNTPKALTELIDREIPGISETIRAYGQARNLFAMFSRSKVGFRKNTLIISLPGSSSGVKEGLNAIFPAITHIFAMNAGKKHVANEVERVLHS
jgi:molybdenum cofactor biosynthesis protein MoaC